MLSDDVTRSISTLAGQGAVYLLPLKNNQRTIAVKKQADVVQNTFSTIISRTFDKNKKAINTNRKKPLHL